MLDTVNRHASGKIEKRGLASMKKRFIILLAALLVLSISLSGCSAINSAKESVEASKNAGIDVDGGWTINDDGTYSFAFVITNTTEDKVAARILYHVDALDEEGNRIPYTDSFYNSGDPLLLKQLMPGKSYVECSWVTDPGTENMFEKTPASFECTVEDISWSDAAAAPVLDITDVQAEVTDDIFAGPDDGPLELKGMPVVWTSYSVTLKNNGQEDFTWSDMGEGYGLFIYVIFRDGDGNIMGGIEAFDEDGRSGGTIAAGEELVLKMGAPAPEGAKTELYPVVNER